jgi:IS30 family transposase
VNAQKQLSVTYDRGEEMAKHERSTAQTGVKVCFADPNAPWQAAPTKTPTVRFANIFSREKT